jgi:hypothetical protein
VQPHFTKFRPYGKIKLWKFVINIHKNIHVDIDWNGDVTSWKLSGGSNSVECGGDVCAPSVSFVGCFAGHLLHNQELQCTSQPELGTTPISTPPSTMRPMLAWCSVTRTMPSCLTGKGNNTSQMNQTILVAYIHADWVDRTHNTCVEDRKCTQNISWKTWIKEITLEVILKVIVKN